MLAEFFAKHRRYITKKLEWTFEKVGDGKKISVM
jgi:hypothetical protein